MIRLISVFLIPFIFLYSYGQSSQSFDFRKLTSYALQGNITKVINVLDILSDETLSAEQLEIKNKYYHRFKFQDEPITFPSDDTSIQQLLNIYQSYWRKALLDNNNIEKYNGELADSITAFLNKHGYRVDTLSNEKMAKSFGLHLKKYLQNKQYYSATGKTGIFFDLFLWTREVPVTYIEQLPETKTNTTVVFIENTLTMGWQEYATFGKAYPGGWATKELLYCVRKAYDTTSENFKVSYLKHEAQHFADYKVYPILTGADLEYRAKLTELVFARQTLYNTIGTFIRNASSEGRNPHAFANFTVIRDLSKVLFNKEFVTDIEQWKSVSPNKISKTSKKLLRKHSRALRRAGASTATEMIK